MKYFDHIISPDPGRTTINSLSSLTLASLGLDAPIPVSGTLTSTTSIRAGYLDAVGPGFGVPTIQTSDFSGTGTPVVPEPSTYALLCISLGVVGFARKKMRKGEA